MKKKRFFKFFSIYIIVSLLSINFSFFDIKNVKADTLIEINSCQKLSFIGNDSAYPLDGDYILTQDIDCADSAFWNDYYEENGVYFTEYIWQSSGQRVNLIKENASIYRVRLSFNWQEGYLADPETEYYFDQENNQIVFYDPIETKTDPSTSHNYPITLIRPEYTYPSGFKPIGSDSDPFSGTFNANNKSISNLKINTDSNFVGLFSVVSGSIENLSLINVDIAGGDRTGALAGRLLAGASLKNINITGNINGYDFTGGVVGGSFGQIDNVHFSGAVNGYRNTGALVGGLSGSEDDFGLVIDSSASGTVGFSYSGDQETGGLIGATDVYTQVINSFSTANVYGSFTAGGLIGTAQGEVIDCYASGNVSSNWGFGVGGLIGYLKSASVIGSYSSGNISATDDGDIYGEGFPSSYAGGLVGLSENSTIKQSYSSGNVSATGYRVGALVGGSNSLIENSYASGNVSGGDRVGGLVGGLALGPLVNSYSLGRVEALGSRAYYEDGGGGGGGYFGGEGGASNASPGAGGSGFLHPTLIQDGLLLSGNNGVLTGALPPNTSDDDYISGVGVGGTISTDKGGDGLVVISYNDQKHIFTYTGSVQSFVVPASVEILNVKIWSAGGGGGDYAESNHQGGSGAYSEGSLLVSQGQNLVIIVGGGGAKGFANSAGGLGGFAGGGDGTMGDASGGGGGGLSGIFANGPVSSFDQLNQEDSLIIAGGGGGGTGYSGPGGAGGGENGSDGVGHQTSCGGSQLAGGSCLEYGSNGGPLFGGNGDLRGSRLGLTVPEKSGGLVGFNYYASISNSFWNIQTSNYDNSFGGSGKNTAELIDQSTFAAWDFDNIWKIEEGSYPCLQWQDSCLFPESSSSYNLNYSAGFGGIISGSASQSVSAGSNGSSVIAIPSSGYKFVRWSDNSTMNPRIDSNVSGNISVSAIFERIASASNTPSMPGGIGDGSRDATISAGNIFGSVVDVGLIDNYGVNVLTYITNKNNFLAPQSSNNWQHKNHSFEIKLLDLFRKRATLIFRSEPIVVELDLKDSKNIDLDKDGVNDIKVTFTDIYVNRAEITIKSLSGQIISQSSPETETIVITNNDLYNKLKGKILLKVEDNGRAYYVSPTKKEMYYLGRPADAFRIMREQGVGATNNDLNKILISGQKADKNIIPNFAKNHSGKIFLQVQDNGEAWYVDTVNNNRHYLGRTNDAFQIMRNLSLGISNVDFDNLYKE